MAAQFKVHINTTTITKYDNNKYDKPKKLQQMKKNLSAATVETISHEMHAKRP